MVIRYVAKKASGRFLFGGRYDPDISIPKPGGKPGETIHDPALAIVELDQMPDLERERWDFDKDAIRAATGEEQAAQAVEQKNAEVLREIDGAKALRAVFQALKIQFPALDMPKLLADAKAIYKTL